MERHTHHHCQTQWSNLLTNQGIHARELAWGGDNKEHKVHTEQHMIGKIGSNGFNCVIDAVNSLTKTKFVLAPTQKMRLPGKGKNVKTLSPSTVEVFCVPVPTELNFWLVCPALMMFNACKNWKKHDVKSTHKNVCPLLRVLKFYLKCLQMRVLTRVLQQSMLTTDTHWDCPQLQVLAHRTQKWVATTEVNKFPSPSLFWSITQWTPSLSSKVFILREAHFQKFWFAEEKTEHNFDPLFPLLMLFASTEVWSHNSALILFTKSCDLIFASIECQL